MRDKIEDEHNIWNKYISDFHNFELDEHGELPHWLSNSIFEKIAFRGNDGKIRFTASLAQFLDNDTKVYPLDNSAQGIFTIGDIKKEIQKELNE